MRLALFAAIPTFKANVKRRIIFNYNTEYLAPKTPYTVREVRA
jgi:hypothetical protein